jgi:ABC-2 type transport system ATP-binding protein
MDDDFVIETQGLSKRFGRQQAVADLSIAVPAGVVAGFVGPNGAGKTTTMGMLLGLVSRTGGTGRVLGEPLDDPAAYLPRVGALIEGPAFYPGLTGVENLRVMAAAGGHDRRQIPDLLDRVGLAGRGDDRFGAYSLGMKQRLAIAAALLGDPALLILDEPANGLDPAGIREMRELISDLADGGRTIFVSSHVLAELEQVCDWFVMIDHGRLVFQGRASELMRGGDAHLVAAPEHAQDNERLRTLLVARGYEVAVNGSGLAIRTHDRDLRAAAADVNRTAAAEGVVLIELRTERMNLEERYLTMVNGGKQ